MLYIVATPIGNLEDISIRQAKTLTSVDIILAEDTRSADVLLRSISSSFHLQPSTSLQLISYYKEKEFEKLPQVIEWLKVGKNIALITDAGMPLISDPGFLLVKTVIKEKIPFTVIPGPSAATTALVLSGFNPAEHLFLGFLPKKESHIVSILSKLKETKKIFPDLVVVFYESPNRIYSTLNLLSTTFPNSQLAICRELTKKFEEVVRGTPKELTALEYKGELTVILAYGS